MIHKKGRGTPNDQAKMILELPVSLKLLFKNSKKSRVSKTTNFLNTCPLMFYVLVYLSFLPSERGFSHIALGILGLVT